jgi:hypothetical protein
MAPRTSTYLRRLALATLFAGAATLSSSAFGDPAVACAAPREWDIQSYDDCMAYILADYQSGKRTFQEYNADAKTCCWTSGGVISETQLCVAPTGEEAQEAERQPSPPPPPPGQVVGPPATLATQPPPPPAPPEGMILWPGYTQIPAAPAR